MKGKFIVIESLDGAGKTTLVESLKEEYKDTILFTREPGGCTLAEELRSLVLNNEMSTATRILLLNAARLEHVLNKIIPALESGKHVICERFFYSTLAYQTYNDVDNRNRELIHYLHDNVININPDLTLLLDIPVEVSLERMRNRELDILENVSLEELNYRRGILVDSGATIIDATQSKESVYHSVKQEIDKLIM